MVVDDHSWIINHSERLWNILLLPLWKPSWLGNSFKNPGGASEECFEMPKVAALLILILLFVLNDAVDVWVPSSAWIIAGCWKVFPWMPTSSLIKRFMKSFQQLTPPTVPSSLMKTTSRRTSKSSMRLWKKSKLIKSSTMCSRPQHWRWPKHQLRSRSWS